MPPNLRVALDANVLVAGVLWPRWPHEVLRAAVARRFDLVLPEQVIEEAERHLNGPAAEALRFMLDEARCERIPLPPADAVVRASGLVRDETDVPVALVLLAGEVDIFVTNDRDFTDPGAVAEQLSRTVAIMLPAVFLRDVLGWSSDALEAIQSRAWSDLTGK